MAKTIEQLAAEFAAKPVTVESNLDLVAKPVRKSHGNYRDKYAATAARKAVQVTVYAGRDGEARGQVLAVNPIEAFANGDVSESKESKRFPKSSYRTFRWEQDGALIMAHLPTDAVVESLKITLG